VDADDCAADTPGFRVPAHTIANLEAFGHDGSATARLGE
jgi:hypothetical protein